MARVRNQKKREEILRCAYKLFYNEGFDNVPLAKIARENGISGSLLQHYYGKKEDLIVELFYDFSFSLYRYIDHNAKRIDDKYSRDAIWYSTYIKIVINNSAFKNICLSWFERSSIMVRSAEFTMTEPAVTDIKSREERIGVHVIDGALSHLLTAYLDNTLPLSVTEVINTCLTVYYKYHEYTNDEITRILEEVEEVATVSFADNFLKSYNKKMELVE